MIHLTASTQPHKLAKPPLMKAMEMETQPRVLRSTLSSRAKQSTASRLPLSATNGIISNFSRFATKPTSNSISQSSRSILKPKLMEHPIPHTGNPINIVNDRRTLRNVSSHSRNPKVTSSANNLSSKIPLGARKDLKKEILETITKGNRANNNFMHSTNRSRALSNNRTASMKDPLWQGNRTHSTLVLSKNPYKEHPKPTSKAPSKAPSKALSKAPDENPQGQQKLMEMGVQTNEMEILNHNLLVGDIRFLNPSQLVVNEIENERKEQKTKELLKATRKFEAHSERQEEHINDLKEFLEKSYVTKKPRKSNYSKDDEQMLFYSMDQFFQRELQKTESITDIKARIKLKEQELLNLFENVQTTSRLASNNN